jgi:hypothetical protein
MGLAIVMVSDPKPKPKQQMNLMVYTCSIYVFEGLAQKAFMNCK